MAYEKRVPNIIIENARIMYRNFAGAESQYNREGDRNFCVIIPDQEYAQQLLEDGWNVKIRPSRDEEEPPMNYLKVAVKYGKIEPDICIVNPRTRLKRRLDADTVQLLDQVNFENIDLIIRPYTWEVNGKIGVAAYIKELYATIVESPFDEKYGDFTRE